MKEQILKLYVVGRTIRSERAIANLRRICEEDLKCAFKIAVVDILEHPQLAEDEKIIATPVVIRELPQPMRRVIGDLSDAEKVLIGLDLHAVRTAPAHKERSEV